jgi:membrane protease subunit (stomatin/prohibitin family)
MFDFLKKQFIDIIEWVEPEDGILSFRFNMEDAEIQTGAKLTVRESQLAMFVNKGQVADIFGAGLHTLNTDNLPILTDLMNWDKGFKSPFKSDVYFFSTREQINQSWGTQAPVTVRDKEFGVIRLRAFGTYSYKIEDPKLFHQKISGTRDTYRAEEMEEQLRAMIMTGMATTFGQSDVNFIDMAANQTEFSNQLKKGLTPTFAEYGLGLSQFYVQSISLPEELQKHLDKVTSMNMLGDLNRYTKFQAAEALEMAAQNEGGVAGVGAGLGAGMAMAQVFTGVLGQGVGGGASGGGTPAEDPMATIQKLHGLMTQGIISQEEFDTKKAELLRKIT